MFYTLSQVALGGAIGSVLRHLCIAGLGAPWATALVNIVGSFRHGRVLHRPQPHHRCRPC